MCHKDELSRRFRQKRLLRGWQQCERPFDNRMFTESPAESLGWRGLREGWQRVYRFGGYVYKEMYMYICLFLGGYRYRKASWYISLFCKQVNKRDIGATPLCLLGRICEHRIVNSGSQLSMKSRFRGFLQCVHEFWGSNRDYSDDFVSPLGRPLSVSEVLRQWSS